MTYPWSKCCYRGMLAIVVLAASMLLRHDQAAAQTEARVSASYITPFPTNDSYKVAVFGAAIAEGVFSGLAPELADDTSIEVVNKSRQGSGLARNEQFDWIAAAEEAVASAQIDIAVVVFGIEDRLSIRLATGKLDLGKAAFDEALALLGGVVFGVLREVAMRPRLGNRADDLELTQVHAQGYISLRHGFKAIHAPRGFWRWLP